MGSATVRFRDRVAFQEPAPGDATVTEEKSPGSSVVQRGRASGQRGWKAHPAGRVARLGGWPGIEYRGSLLPSFGTEPSRARVYGCLGASNSSRTGACSMSLPAYITATLSHIFATIPRLCVTKIRATPVSRWMSLSRSRYCAWMVTSRFVVGSSAMTRLGPPASAIAPTMRWRMPPLIWWG
jgi:hypothetical protein